MTYSAGLSGGYDFLVGGLTLSPTIGFFYIDATIDSFTESGAAGLNLIYDEQTFQSFTGNLGFRVTYAWNLSWGVLLPHLRVDYVREFKDRRRCVRRTLRGGSECEEHAADSGGDRQSR